MQSKWFKEKENLQNMILVQKTSYEEIGKYYSCTGANIKKVAIKIGIQLPQRRKLNENETFNKGTGKKYYCLNCGQLLSQSNGKNYRHKYCSNKCQKEHQHKIRYKKILDGDPSIMRATYIPSRFKNDILQEQNGVCAICSCKPEWNGKPLVFILDHIDGRASNNKRDNLRCICPNCDSQLDTYKSKNKNSDRLYYHEHHR